MFGGSIEWFYFHNITMLPAVKSKPLNIKQVQFQIKYPLLKQKFQALEF